MQNVNMTVKANKLLIEALLTNVAYTVEKSGNSMIATTKGYVAVPGAEGFMITLNLILKKGKDLHVPDNSARWGGGSADNLSTSIKGDKLLMEINLNEELYTTDKGNVMTSTSRGFMKLEKLDGYGLSVNMYRKKGVPSPVEQKRASAASKRAEAAKVIQETLI